MYITGAVTCIGGSSARLSRPILSAERPCRISGSAQVRKCEKNHGRKINKTTQQTTNKSVLRKLYKIPKVMKPLKSKTYKAIIQ